MADKRKLLELDIDVESIIAKSSQLKTELDSLRATQTELKKSGDTNSETYVKLSAQISRVSSEFNINQKQLTNLAAVNGNYLTIQQKVGLALDKENVSISEARSNNTELLKIRNELNLSRADEKALADEINAKLDRNNAFIKENVSQYEKQKIGIGDYKTAITEAIGETGLFNGQLSGLKTAYETGLKVLSPFKNDISTTANNMRNAAVETEGMSVAQKSLTIATNIGTGAMRIFALAIAATGIGLIIIAVALLIGYLKGLDPVMDKIEQAFAGFGGVIEFLENKIGDFIEGITSVGDALNKLGSFLANPIDSLKSLGKEMGNAAKEAANLKERQQELEDQMSINSILNKKQESEISRLMIQAKDRSKSASEQNKAFVDAEKLNADIFERNKSAATESLNIAIEEAKKKKKLTAEEIERLKELDIVRATSLLNEGKISIASYKQLQESFSANIEVENQYNEQLDKITTKSNNAIEKQQADAEASAKKAEERKQKILDDAAALSKTRLDLFLSEQGTRAKSLEEELRINETILAKKLEIAKKEFEASKKTEADKLQLLINENNARNEFLQKQNEFIINTSKAELDLFVSQNVSKLENAQLLTQELINEESLRLNSIKLDKINLIEQEKQTNQTIIDEKRTNNEELSVADIEYLTLKNNLEAEFRNENKANQDAFEQQVKEQKAAQLIADREIELANVQSKFEEENLIVQQQYDVEIELLNENLKKQLLTQEQFDAKVANADKKKKELLRIAELNDTQGKLNEYKKLGEGLAGLFGKNKLIASALAGINTALGVTEILKTPSVLPEPLASISRAVQIGTTIATGVKSIAEINGAKFATGEIDIDGPGSTTSDSIPALLSRGESVINAEATANNKELLRAINSNAGLDFSKQSFPSSVANIYNSNQNSTSIDYDLLAGKISDANRNLPAPVVYTAVEDINYGQKNYAQVVNGANF